MKKIKKKSLERKPSTPGEVLREMFLSQDMTQIELANELCTAAKGKVKLSTMKTKLSEVVNDKRKISAEFSYLLSLVLGTNPKMWLNLQANVDLYEVEKEFGEAA